MIAGHIFSDEQELIQKWRQDRKTKEEWKCGEWVWAEGGHKRDNMEEGAEKS